MKLWGKRSTPNAQRSTFNKELTEAQLNTALAVGIDTPLWLAVLQLIDTAEANANDNAGAPDVTWMQMAGYVGGAAHLRMLREELVNRRENGLRLVGALATSTKEQGNAWD